MVIFKINYNNFKRVLTFDKEVRNVTISLKFAQESKCTKIEREYTSRDNPQR